MKTRMLPISIESPDRHSLETAAALITDGQLVAFPTETVYGLGADAFNPTAVQSIFSVKKRPSTDPIIVHIENKKDLTSVAINIPELAWKLANRYWPGPLTLILEKHPNIPFAITAGGTSVAVRMPDHPIALMLIALSGCPVAAPSANQFSRPSPTQAHHVWNDLKGRIPMILDSGPTHIGLESTVLDLMQSPPCILRPGGIPLEKLKTMIPDIQVRKSFLKESKQNQLSPGQLFKHYSPNVPLLLFQGPSPEKVTRAMYAYMKKMMGNQKQIGAMIAEEDIVLFQELQQKGGRIENMGSINQLDQIAQNLFSCMRNLEASNVDMILICLPPDNELGLAINDRLVRAAKDVVWIN